MAVQSNDSNGINTYAVEVFTRKWFNGLAKAKTFYDQYLSMYYKMDNNLHNGDTTTISIIQEFPVNVAPHVEGSAVAILPTGIAKQQITVLQYAYKILFTDKFMQLSMLEMDYIFRDRLADHWARTIDTIAHDLVFNLTNLVCAPKAGALTTDLDFATDGGGTLTNAGTYMTLAHMRLMHDVLHDSRVPEHKGTGDYVLIGTATNLRVLLSEIYEQSKYVPAGYEKLLTGEVVKFDGIRIVLENNVKSKNVYMFGDEIGMKVVVSPEELVVDTPQDLKTIQGIGWKLTMGARAIQRNRILKFLGHTGSVITVS